MREVLQQIIEAIFEMLIGFIKFAEFLYKTHGHRLRITLYVCLDYFRELKIQFVLSWRFSINKLICIFL